MTITTRQAQHGFRSIIEDKENKEKWSGNIENSMEEARESAIDGYIREKIKLRKEVLNNLEQLEKSIEELNLMRK